MSKLYRIGGFALGVVGILVIFVFDPSKVHFTAPVVGIGVFAVLYVIAQAVERVVEWITEGLKLIPDSPGAKKVEAVRVLRQVNSTLNGNPSPADFATAQTQKAAKELEVDNKRTDVLFVGLGLSILFAAIAVNLLNYGMMKSLGATDLNADIDRLLTALAAAGGSKSLHELIGRVQAAKENAQTAS